MTMRVATILAALLCLGCPLNPDGLRDLLLAPPADNRPRVVESHPSANVTRITPDSQLFVEFDRPMDEEQTRDSFSISGTGVASGRFEWSGHRLYFRPTQALETGASYVMRVSRSALSRDGYPLEVDYIIHFTVGSRVDAPTILATDPTANASGISPDASVRLVFSRAMNTQSVEDNFSITPSAAGAFSWQSGNSVLLYTPYNPLSTGSTYSVSLGPQVADEEGIPLGTTFSMNFQVGSDFTRPSVTGMLESGNPTALSEGVTGVYKDSYFTVRFDEPMEHVSTRTNFSLTRLSSGLSVAGTAVWNGTFTELRFTPDSPLEPENDYRIEVATGARDLAGNNLSAAYRVRFTVNSNAGAAHSIYLRVTSAAKNLPAPAPEALSLDVNQSPVLTVGGAGGTFGDSMRLEFIFSHSLDIGSVPDNISFRRVTGVGAQTGRIIAITFASDAPLVNNRLIIDFDSIGINEYELTVSGGRNGVRSAGGAGETGTWLSDDLLFYFKVNE